MTSLAELSRTLRHAAAEAKIGVTELSDLAGVSRPTARKVLSGDEDYRLTTLLAMADRLGLEVVLVPKGLTSGIAAPTQSQAYVPSIVDIALGTPPPSFRAPVSAPVHGRKRRLTSRSSTKKAEDI